MAARIDAALAEELLQMEREGHRLRAARADSSGDGSPDAAILAADAAHTARLKELVASRGWPVIDLVGFEASQAAWLLALRAESDIHFQKECLGLLWKAFERDEVDGSGPATLEDSIRLAEGRKQLYGMLFDDAAGSPLPIEDEAGVDERRATAGLPPLAEQLRRMRPVVPENPKLREELLLMEKEDQSLRNQWPGDSTDESVFEKTREVDRTNTARMKEIVSALGWPGVKLVGWDGAQAAWLLVQHADADPAFQERCLVLMREAFAKGDFPGQELAYLEDRVRVNTGREQLYGTQCTERDGRLEPHPIEDRASVDERRAKVGLLPLERYLARMRRRHGV